MEGLGGDGVDKGMQVYGRKKRLHKEDTYLIAVDWTVTLEKKRNDVL